MIVDGLELLGTRWRINPRPCDWIAQRVLDELEVGHRAAKVWSWGPHYCPPESYARIRRDQAARDARKAAEPAPVLVSETVAPQPAMPKVDFAGPLLFGVHSEGRSDSSYGGSYWCVGLPDGREAYLLADTVEVLPNGSLRCAGAFRPHPLADAADAEQTTLLLAPGAWVHAYASSGIDSAPVAVTYLQEPG